MVPSSPLPNSMRMQPAATPPNNIAATVRLPSPPSERYGRHVADPRALFSDDADKVAKRDALPNRVVEGVSSPPKKRCDSKPTSNRPTVQVNRLPPSVEGTLPLTNGSARVTLHGRSKFMGQYAHNLTVVSPLLTAECVELLSTI